MRMTFNPLIVLQSNTARAYEREKLYTIINIRLHYIFILTTSRKGTQMDRYTFGNDFQEMILSYILNNHEVITGLRSVVKPNYFSLPVHRDLCKMVMEFIGRYKSSPNKKELIELIKDKYVEKKNTKEMIQVAKELYAIKLKNIKYIKDQIIGFAQFSSMKEAIVDSSELVGSYENHIQIKKRISEALKVGMDSKKSGSFLFEGATDRILDRELKGIDHNRVTTGLKELDRQMGGGLDIGELGVILAPPKGFKTGILTNLGVAAMGHQKRVVHFTLEVSETNQMLRYERRIAGLNKREIISNSKRLESRLEMMEKLGGGLVVKGFPIKSVTVGHLNEHLDFLETEGFKADVVIVDYGDIVKPSSSGEKRNQIADIYMDLRALGQERKVRVWTASQANRKATGKRVIRKDDIAEAFEKVAIADCVIAHCQTKEERLLEIPQARLFMAANREGEEGGITYIQIDYNKMMIREMKKNKRSKERGNYV